MKYLLVTMLSMLWAASQVIAQNPNWSFPPKYVNFNAGGAVQTLGAGTKTKNGVSNAIFSKTGNLLLYGTGNSSSYLNAADALTSLENSTTSSADLGPIPIPGKCDSYFVPAMTIPLENIGQGERQYPYSIRPGYMRVIRFQEISFSDEAGHFCPSYGGGEYGSYHQNSLGIAAPITPSISGPERKPYLYVARVSPVTPHVAFTIYNYTSNNINIDIFYGQSGTVNNKTSFTVANMPPEVTDIREVDLSFDGTKLAFSLSGKNIIYLINNVNNCVDGTCSSSNLTQIAVSGATAVNGVEFSPDGTKLFYTKSTTSSTANQIAYVDLVAMTHTDVTGSANLGQSFLEYAIDGYMYVSDGSSLKGFTMTAPFAVTKTIANVPNSQFEGVYTLPDQIDGANYAGVGGDCQNGPVTFTANALPAFTKASGLVTASGTSFVASGASASLISATGVKLKPNFRARSGSSFKAKIASCSNVCTANGCASSSYRIATADGDDIRTEESHFHVHPNPIHSGYLNFGRLVGSFSLLSSTGVEIAQGKNVHQLDVTGLSKGVYMLKLDDKVEKVIVD